MVPDHSLGVVPRDFRHEEEAGLDRRRVCEAARGLVLEAQFGVKACEVRGLLRALLGHHQVRAAQRIVPPDLPNPPPIWWW